MEEHVVVGAVELLSGLGHVGGGESPLRHARLKEILHTHTFTTGEASAAGPARRRCRLGRVPGAGSSPRQAPRVESRGGPAADQSRFSGGASANVGGGLSAVGALCRHLRRWS
jgi:hypothetical protein